MNAAKEKILKIAADLMLGRETRPSSGSLANVKSLEQCIAFVLETRSGRNPVHVIGCHLNNEEHEIFPEIIWDLLCARVIMPGDEGKVFDRIRRTLTPRPIGKSLRPPRAFPAEIPLWPRSRRKDGRKQSGQWAGAGHASAG